MLETFSMMVPRKFSEEELTQAIRKDITDELDAIILYESHAAATDDERAKKVFLSIADEERRHVGEFQQLLFLLNPKEGQLVEEGKQKIQQQQASNFMQPLQ